VGTRSHMCHGGWELRVHGVSAIICMFKLIKVRSMVSYYVCCRMICTYIYLSYAYKMRNIIQNMVFVVPDIGSLIYFMYNLKMVIVKHRNM